jgi:hypothetical protein
MTTILYLMSLTEEARTPFSLVDETRYSPFSACVVVPHSANKLFCTY